MEKVILPLFAMLILSSCQESKHRPVCYGNEKEGYTVRMDEGNYYKWSDDAKDTTDMKVEAIIAFRKKGSNKRYYLLQ